MRIILPLLLVAAAPALAWEFRAGETCELTHDGAAASVRVSYDPRLPLYAITVTRPVPWPEGPIFGIDFIGPRGLIISTGRHVLSEDGRALTVTDSGFGNVLDGLQFNDTAIALSGGASVAISLDGAAPAVEAFRACIAAPVA